MHAKCTERTKIWILNTAKRRGFILVSLVRLCDVGGGGGGGVRVVFAAECISLAIV